MQSVQSKNLPDFLKRHLKTRKFSKRTISVDIKSSVSVYPNQHAAEYDNFDYSYHDLADVSSGSVKTDIQEKGSNGKSFEKSLSKGEIIISGDRLNGYASLTMNQETFNKYFNEDLKSVTDMLKGAALELLSLRKAKLSLENSASGGLLIRDLESKIGEKAIPHHKNGKKQIAAANQVVEENKEKIANMSFYNALSFISQEVQKKTGKSFSWNSWDSWQ
jgi:hypothetical protein